LSAQHPERIAADEPTCGAALALAGAAVLALLVLPGCAFGGSSSGTPGFGGNSDAGADAGGKGGAQGSGNGTGGLHGTGGASGVGTGGATAGGSGGSAATGGSSSTGGTSGAGGAAVGCNVSIQPVSPVFLDGIEAGPGVKVRVRAAAFDPSFPTPTWSWTVTSALSAAAIVPMAIDGTGAVVEFPVATPGAYQIVVRLVGDARCRPGMQVFTAIAPQGPSFTFRTTAAGYPTQETRVRLSGGSMQNFSLDPGVPYSIKPRVAGMQGLMGAYVRVSSPDTTFDIEGNTTHTPVVATLLPLLAYDLLIVPLDPYTEYAPWLISSQPPAAWSQGIDIDQGVRVDGLALAADGTPLANARMILQQATRPSTVGISDATGALHVWTRPGTMSAVVVPPDGAGLPQANVAATNDLGVVLPANGTGLTVTMRWANVAHGALAINVTDSAGAVPQANAQVRVSLQRTLARVGTMTVSTPGANDVMLAASGSFDGNLSTDATGRVSFPALPVGTYDVTVTPPVGSPAALTTTTVTLSSAGLSQTIPLAQKVRLAGSLLPLPAGKAALVTALDAGAGATGTASMSVVGDDGSFALSVAPNRTYELIVRPASGRVFGRAVIAGVEVGPSGATVPTIMLPGGLPFSGLVQDNGMGIGGAFVQVFCVSSAATCADPSVSLAEATTLGDGTYSLILPDPTN